MGLLQDWGGKISNEGKKVWKSGKHWVEQTFGDAGDFIDRKVPEFRVNVDAKIDAKVQIDKDNFNVRMDSRDFAKSLATIGTGIESGLGTLGTAIGGSLQSFGENLSRGLEQLGEELGNSVQIGLSQLGNDLNSAAVQVAAGISSHGTSIESASGQLAQFLNAAVIEGSRNFQNGLAILGASIEKFDATGGVGRYLLANVQYSQAAGQKLISLDQYFSRIAGENVFDTYLLKVANVSSRPLADLRFLTNVIIRGIGGTEFQTIRIQNSPTRGNFTLTFQGQSTGSIPWNATPDAIQSRLESLATVGAGNVICEGSALPDGDVEVIFTGALAGNVNPSIIATSADFTVTVEKTDFVAQEEKEVVVIGDPIDGPHLFEPGHQAVVTLGRFRRELGVPYVSSVAIELLPTEQQKSAARARGILQDGNFSTGARVRAASELSALGSFAWGELAAIRVVRDDVNQPTLVREAASDAVNSIESFQLDAVATIVLSTGELLEPVSMLRAQLDAPIVLALAAGPLAIRLPVTVDRSFATPTPTMSRRIKVQPVNDCDINNADLTPRRRVLFGESSSSAPSGLTVLTLQDALDQARKLGLELREMVPPDQFKTDAAERSIYSLVREVLEPTFTKLRAALKLLDELSPHFERRFRIYSERGIDDPGLTHLLGVEVLDDQNQNATLTVDIDVTDVVSGNNVRQTIELAIKPATGEALIPLPLRFVDTKKKRVTIGISAVANAIQLKTLSTHFSGLIGNFAIMEQTTSGQIRFYVQRMVDISA